MKPSEVKLNSEEIKSLLRYFKILLRVLKRLQKESKANPTIVDHLEPEFRLFLSQV